MEAFQGWAADPFGTHEERYFLQGRPTGFVRDGDVQSVDDSPGEAPEGEHPATGSHPTPPPPSMVAPPPPEPLWARALSASTPGDAAPPATSEFPGLSDSFAMAAPSPAAKSSKQPLVGIAAALVVVVAVVSSLALVIGGGKSAEAEVITAVNSTLADHTAHMTMSYSAGTGNTTVTGSGSGAVNFSQNALQLHMTVSAAGHEVPMDASYLGGVAYINIPGLDQLVPGKSWISIDFSSLQQAASQNPGTIGATNNPSTMLRVLAQHGNTVVPLGSSTVGSVAVQGYSVTLNASSIRSQLNQGRLPSWMQQALSNVDFQGMGAKVFVDDSGLLRRMTMHMTMTAGSSGPVTMDESLDFSDYGTPVSVSAPPPDQVLSFEQFLSDARQAAGSGA